MFWIGIILIIVGIFFILVLTQEDYQSIIALPIILIICGVMICKTGIDKNTPTALDVYRGKTTLEITYRDSVAVDSVVVFIQSQNNII
jgi:hypothetical protein